MLVLTRKTDEVIRIGDDVVIKVIQTRNGSVKIGIEAPSDVRIMRGELLERARLEPIAPVVTAAVVGRVLSDQYPHVA